MGELCRQQQRLINVEKKSCIYLKNIFLNLLPLVLPVKLLRGERVTHEHINVADIVEKLEWPENVRTNIPYSITLL